MAANMFNMFGRGALGSLNAALAPLRAQQAAGSPTTSPAAAPGVDPRMAANMFNMFGRGALGSLNAALAPLRAEQEWSDHGSPNAMSALNEGLSRTPRSTTASTSSGSGASPQPDVPTPSPAPVVGPTNGVAGVTPVKPPQGVSPWGAPSQAATPVLRNITLGAGVTQAPPGTPTSSVALGGAMPATPVPNVAGANDTVASTGPAPVGPGVDIQNLKPGAGVVAK